MKIAIATSGRTLESLVDARFGRCLNFLIVDSQTNEFEVMENTAQQAFRGAGISAAQMVVNQGVKAVIAGNFGPNAVNVLNRSGIKIFKTALGIKAKQALEEYKSGKLEAITATTNSFSMTGRGWGWGGWGRGRGRR